MPSVRIQQEFAIPADVLWDLVGEFGNMSKWTGFPAETCVADGEGIGATRTLRPSNGGVIVDRLDAQTDRSYSYSIVNMSEAPLPYSSYKATMSVLPVTETSSQLVWEGHFKPDGITGDEAVAFTEKMYARGVELMKASASQL